MTTIGTILQDLDRTVSNGSDYAPTGYLVGVSDSSDSYGSVLYDLDRSTAPAVATQPSIGDDADDFGSILYDTGSVY